MANKSIIRGFSTEELKRELDRRKEKPSPLSKPDLKHLIEATDQYLEAAKAEEIDILDSIQQDIFEHAMLAIYGPNIFTWTRLVMPSLDK